jgi:hypothetical protein
MMMKQDINHHIINFTSSRRVENSETRIKIVKLGQKLVKVLSSESDIDPLSKWMVHYIAEQIKLAKSAKGKKKLEAERNCFETILKLWKHRVYLPSGHRPFENFETIFRVLEKIDPSNKKQFYYEQPIEDKSKSKKKISAEVKKWLDIALVLDEAARVWLSQVFKYAAKSATDKETIIWLEAVSGLAKEEDISVVIGLFGEKTESEESKAEKIKNEKQNRLIAKIKQLDSFVIYSKELKAIFKKDLQKLK